MHKSNKRIKTKNIILGVTASIAIYKACEIVRQLLREAFCINVVMTDNATELVSPQLFACLTNGWVHPTPFPEGKPVNRPGSCDVYNQMFMHPEDWQRDWGIEHIALAKQADLVLIAPATANIIGKITNGIADDLLTTTVMATRAPVLIAPAMNEGMYKNKIVQSNIQKLKQLGYKFIEPQKGRLACGDVGIGHLAEVDAIITAVKQYLK